MIEFSYPTGFERGLGQQVRPQQVGERPGVDRVVLHPARADRLGRQWMGHVGCDAGVGEQVGEPAPAIRRLEGDLDRLWLELTEHSARLGWIVHQATAQRDVAGLVERDDMRDLAVQVHPEVHHVRASSRSLVFHRP
jgi:hypothetical protein